MMLLHDAFDFHARSRGDACFTIFEGRSVSYAEARAQSDAFAGALQRAGLKQGDRLCLLSRNCPELFLLFFAASRLGVVITPLNTRLAPPEWAAIIADSTARVLIAEPHFAQTLDASNALAGADLRLLTLGGASPGWETFEGLVEAADPPAPTPTPGVDDIVFQIYTSGTTGRAKGALLSHAALVSNIVQSSIASPHKLSPGERTLVVLPLFHIAAIATALGAIHCGATLVIHREVDPARIAQALAEDEIVVASLVPAVIQFLLVGVPGLAEMKFPHLKSVGYGASPIAEPVLRRAMEVFKCRFVQGYGMTELAGSCCMLSEVDHRKAMEGRPELLLSAGKALPGCEVRVVDPDDNELPRGETGEIIVRGPQLMSGYWNMPEASAEALRGGWMHTGDAGYMDEEGYLYIRDRIKDMIVSGAENVYPAEVESVLHQHPGIADVAVIGAPDARWGETVMAVIVRRNGEEVSVEELDVFCRARLGGFKLPRRYEFVEVLPRNAAGKILKRELREAFWEGHDRRVS